MLANFLARFTRSARPVADRRPLRARLLRAALLLVWMATGFGLALIVVQALIYALGYFDISFDNLDDTILNASVMAILYVVTAVIIIGVPWLVRSYRTSKEELGLTRLLSWGDIGLALLAVVVYFLLAWLMLTVAEQIVPTIDLAQAQETGFPHPQEYYQYLLALAALVFVAPIAEELLFRGYLYGKLRRLIPVWAAAIVVSLAFGAVHGQWNVAIDVFALSLVLCTLRELTGNIWAGILLHMLKNAIAYYVLFIYPLT